MTILSIPCKFIDIQKWRHISISNEQQICTCNGNHANTPLRPKTPWTSCRHNHEAAPGLLNTPQDQSGFETAYCHRRPSQAHRCSLSVSGHTLMTLPRLAIETRTANPHYAQPRRQNRQCCARRGHCTKPTETILVLGSWIYSRCTIPRISSS